MYLREAIDGYIIESRVENKTPKTIHNLTWELGRFSKWKGEIPVESVSSQNLREYIILLQDRGLSGHSVHTAYKSLRSFFRWCAREELVAKDPTLRFKAPQLPELLPKALEPGQVAILLARLRKDKVPERKRNELIIHTLLGTGLRASELCALDMGSVFLESSYILVRQGKGRKDRVVPIEPVLNKELWKYIKGWRRQVAGEREPALFVGKTGKRLRLHGLQAMCRRHLRAIDSPGSVHIFRHTFASIYLRNGGSIETLRRVLGHESTEMTTRYVSLLPNDLVNQQVRISPLESVLR